VCSTRLVLVRAYLPAFHLSGGLSSIFICQAAFHLSGGLSSPIFIGQSSFHHPYSSVRRPFIHIHLTGGLSSSIFICQAAFHPYSSDRRPSSIFICQSSFHHQYSSVRRPFIIHMHLSGGLTSSIFIGQAGFSSSIFICQAAFHHPHSSDCLSHDGKGAVGGGEEGAYILLCGFMDVCCVCHTVHLV
jgi:hypothetical protein